MLPKPVVLSVLKTEAPAAQPCTFSPAEMLWPISSPSPSGPIASGLVASRIILPLILPSERMAASACGHGVVSTMKSADAAASAGTTARALPPILLNTACVFSAAGLRTPNKMSCPAFCAHALPSVPPTLPAPMMAIFMVEPSSPVARHCEERSDEAIQKRQDERLDCFAALAMTRSLSHQHPAFLGHRVL